MAKSKRGSIKTRKSSKLSFDDNLPQNIVEIGHIDKDISKRIYISQQTFRTIHLFTKNKTTNESGGMLIGQVIEEFGKTNIVIRGFIEAKYTEATPTTLKFTHETWEYVHKELDRKYENAKIVGWIHTHPNFGIFLSDYDMFIHGNFFSDENQVAYVVDPIQHQEGFYIWKNKQIEKSEGFYVFDNPGNTIKISNNTAGSEFVDSDSNISKPRNIITGILIGLLILSVLILSLISVNSLNRLSILESQQESIVESANQAIYSLQTENQSLAVQLRSLSTKISNLETKVQSISDTVNSYHPETTNREDDENVEEDLNVGSNDDAEDDLELPNDQPDTLTTDQDEKANQDIDGTSCDFNDTSEQLATDIV